MGMKWPAPMALATPGMLVTDTSVQIQVSSESEDVNYSLQQ